MATTVIVLVPLLPWAIDKLLGEAVRVKLPSAFTVNVIVVVALRLPEVPVMVMVDVPSFAVLLAVKLTTLVGNAGFGLKFAVTPFGKAEVVNVTLLSNPLVGVTVIVLVPVAPPLAMVTELGEAEREKLCTN